MLGSAHFAQNYASIICQGLLFSVFLAAYLIGPKEPMHVFLGNHYLHDQEGSAVIIYTQRLWATLCLYYMQEEPPG